MNKERSSLEFKESKAYVKRKSAKEGTNGSVGASDQAVLDHRPNLVAAALIVRRVNVDADSSLAGDGPILQVWVECGRRPGRDVEEDDVVLIVRHHSVVQHVTLLALERLGSDWVASARQAIRMLGALVHVPGSRNRASLFVKPRHEMGKGRRSVILAAGHCIALNVALGVVVANVIQVLRTCKQTRIGE